MNQNKPDSLAVRCQAYLKQGPPKHMKGYVAGSILEIIIGHGATSKALDPDLQELGGLVLQDAQDSATRQKDEAIRAYLQQGADLVSEVLEG